MPFRLEKNKLLTRKLLQVTFAMAVLITVGVSYWEYKQVAFAGHSVSRINIFPGVVTTDTWSNETGLFAQDVNESGILQTFTEKNAAYLSQEALLQVEEIFVPQLPVTEEASPEERVILDEENFVEPTTQVATSSLEEIVTTSTALKVSPEVVFPEESQVEEIVIETKATTTEILPAGTATSTEGLENNLSPFEPNNSEAIPAQGTTSEPHDESATTTSLFYKPFTFIAQVLRTARNVFSQYVLADETATSSQPETTDVATNSPAIAENSTSTNLEIEENPEYPIGTTSPQTSEELITEGLSTSSMEITTINIVEDTPIDPIDTVPPQLKILGNNPAILEVGATYNDLGALIENSDDQNIGVQTSVNGVSVRTVEIDTSAPNRHEIVYTAIDGAGNTSQVKRIVIVGDPVLEDIATESTSTEESIADAPLLSSQTTFCGMSETCLRYTVELSDFGLTPNTIEGTIVNAQVRLSLAAQSKTITEIPEEGLIVEYFFENDWHHGGSIPIQGEISNALNGGYFLVALPIFETFDALSEFKIRVRYENIHGEMGTVFLDAVWVQIQTATEIHTDDLELEIEEKGVVYRDGLIKSKTSDVLAPSKLDFNAGELPTFRLRYYSQRNPVVRYLRKIFANQQYELEDISLIHPGIGKIKSRFEVVYGENGEWEVVFTEVPKDIRPGKYKLTFEIREGGKVFQDELEFYWGVLAINSHKSIYLPGEEAQLSMAALTDTGNTICDADLELTVTDPEGVDTVLAGLPSGFCHGNNVTTIPDYTAVYTTNSVGAYTLHLARKDEEGNAINSIDDFFEVRQSVPFVVERTGPTRIYPPAPYEMKFTIKANRGFQGQIIETLPFGFEVFETDGRLGSTPERLTLTWDVNLAPAEEIELTYRFDAPDISPFLYRLGPLQFKDPTILPNLPQRQPRNTASTTPSVEEEILNTEIDHGVVEEKTSLFNRFKRFALGAFKPEVLAQNTNASTSQKVREVPEHNPCAYEDCSILFEESRQWSIASDATGNMIMFWDGDSIPTGWSCISCTPSDDFFGRFPRGAATYGATGGSATTSHTVEHLSSSNSTSTVDIKEKPDNTLSADGHAHNSLTNGEAQTTSTLPAYRTLKVIQSDTAGEPSQIPTGAIGVFDASVPSGWTQYSNLDDRFVQGSSTAGTNDGADTHEHQTIITTGGPSALSNGKIQNGPDGATSDHTHSGTSTATSTNNLPPYIEVIFGQLNATTTPPDDLITMWSDTPPAGWITNSGSGEAFNNQFLRGSTTYNGTSQGTTTHEHSNLTITTDPPSSSIQAESSGATLIAVADDQHLHDITISIDQATHTPPYIEAIFAKRIGLVPLYTQNYFRWFANTNAEPPTDFWPSGAGALFENETITATGTPLEPNDQIRLRMSVNVTNATATAQSVAFKLQFAEGATCSVISEANWSDVGQIASSTIWRGYNNTSVSDGTTLSSTTLSVSDVFGSYEEENNSTSTPNEIGVGEDIEFDWVLENNNATSGTPFCFRMTESNGTALDVYGQYPQLTTNSVPTATLSKLFDNEQVASTSPWFEFVGTDTEGESLHYQVQIDDNNDFSSTVVDANSEDDVAEFSNLVTPSDKAPFNDGETAQFKSTTTLSNNTTYWWRVRAIDPNGSNTWGSWSSSRSFTVDTSTTISTWFQTTEEQFDTDTLENVDAVASDQMELSGGSVGTTTSTSIDFDDATSGNIWGELQFNDTEGAGNILYYIEYAATSTFELIPDSDLSGNSTGFDSSPVSLSGLDTTAYNVIRIVSVFASPGTPSVQDWTVEWGTQVSAPTLLKLFSNEKMATTTPAFEFFATDVESDDLEYEISWSTTTSFTSSTTRNSLTDPTGFENLASTTDTSPFISGDTIRYTIQPVDALTSSTTYWWRARAKDPSGGDVWGDWATMRSFTHDYTVIVTTWYQTTTDQFNTDILSGTQANNNEIEVATTSDEALIAYAEGSVQTPRYREWDGSSWSTEGSALSVGATINWIVTGEAPTREEYILGTLGTDQDVNVQIFSQGAWGNLQEMTPSISSAEALGFDIAYETNSGDALVAYCDGDADPSYRIWDGSSWGSEGSINLASSNDCHWIELASDPVVSSDEIILLSRDASGSQYEAQVWDGSSWGNSTTLGGMSETGHAGMSVEYEASGDQGIIITGDTTHNRFRWNSWDGSSWSGSSERGLGKDLEWAYLVRDDDTDNMNLCYIDGDSDIGVVRWTGAGWVAQVELETSGNGKDDRPVSCQFETTAGRDGYIMTTYSDDTAARYSFWNGSSWSTEASISTITDAATVQSRRTGDGTILSVFFDDVNDRYDFSSWNGTSWSTAETLEDNASVGSSPFHEPFMIAPRGPASSGTVTVTPAIDFDDGTGPFWDKATWTEVTPGSSDILMQVQYATSGTYELIPDVDLQDNSTGTTTSPIDLSSLDTSIYNELRLLANLNCSGVDCPTLQDWTLEWAEGITISGTANQYDQVASTTSGTVAVAVNGTLQSGKTGTIASDGTWSIPNVTAFVGDHITVFIDGAADQNESVAVTKYTSVSNVTGIELFERHLTIGSDHNGTTTNSDLGLFDFTASGDEDIFFEVDAGNDLEATSTGSGFDDVELYIQAGDEYRPDSSSSGNVTVHDIEINGEFITDGNTITLSGSWDNNGAFASDSSTILFTATSTTEFIDSTGSATSSFNVVSFGQTSGTATWELGSYFDVNGNLLIDYGTLFASTSSSTLAGNLTINANGFFAKGSATTTFDGVGTSVWTDSTTPTKQDLGMVAIDGTTKTIQLGSNVRATDITIGANDTLNVTGSNHDIEVFGNWTNNNVFTAQQGEVIFATSSPGAVINPGSSSFYDLRFRGSGGGWSFDSQNITITNDFTIASGTVTMAVGTTTIGGSLTNIDSFVHNNGAVYFTSTSGGKTVTASTSPFYNIAFEGSGGAWAFQDNATTSNNFLILIGSLTAPSGTLAVGNQFDNNATFVHNNGTLRLFATTEDRVIDPGNSNLGSVVFDGIGGGWNLPTTTDVTVANDLTIENGTATSSGINLLVGGSWLVNSGGTFQQPTGTTTFNSTDAGETVNPGNSPFANVVFESSTGGWSITGDATSTESFNLASSSDFTVLSGTSVEVGSTFSNSVGGASTTWSGSTLYLNSGTDYTINTKGIGDQYGNFIVGPNTDIRMWDSEATSSTNADVSGSLYSQDHAAIDGELYIWGTYERTSGTDFWNYATDFDGTDLTGSERQVTVRLSGGNASTTMTGGTLEILGTSTASTTVTNQGSGTYGMLVSGGTLNAQYYVFRNIDGQGLSLQDGTIFTSLDDGDFELAVNDGSLISISTTTIDANNEKQIYRVRFATSTGGSSGFNVNETGSTASFVWFRDHYGGFDGEFFDNDSGSPGEIRWDDSNNVITVSGTVYADEGLTAIGNPPCDGSSVVRVRVDGGGNHTGSCNAITGAYSIAGVPFTGDVVLTVYLDDAIDGSRAVSVSKTPTGDITDMDLYENRVIVRHEDLNEMTIADMAVYDAVDDVDVLFTAATGTPDTLSLPANTELHVWTGKTFTPVGNMTLNSGGSGDPQDGSLHVGTSSTLAFTGTESHSVGGSFTLTTSSLLDAANSTLTFTATTTGKTIAATSSFNSVIFNGSGGEWTLASSTTISDDMTVTAGTVIGSQNVTVEGGDVTGNGTINLSGGTFTLEGTGNLGGNSDWTFSSLTLGDGAAVATTTKAGSGNVSVGGVLTIDTNHVFDAAGVTWTLSGSGTPFVINGTFDANDSLFSYTGTAATNITQTTYKRLLLAASGGSPVYTMQAGTFSILDTFTVGDGVNAVTVNANTSDPVIVINGDSTINGSGTFISSNSATLTVGASWDNNGSFTHSNGTVEFNASTTGQTIAAGLSPFFTVNIASSTGGWTFGEHATATNNFNINSASVFTVSPNVSLAVGGQFSNGVGGANTTWTDSTLRLYSGSNYTINASTTNDVYSTLIVDTNTDVRMWNSSAATTTVVDTSSLYSQDHAQINGDLYVWGDYENSTGNDFWSYATDFDGTSLSGGSERQVDVRLATSATTTLSGGTLSILGGASASTTIDNQGSGEYALVISGGTFNAQYYVIRNIASSGLLLTATPTITNLSNGDFLLENSGGSMITAGATVIDNNPSKTFFNNIFATSTGVSSGFNVTATGTAVNSWRFTGYAGNYGGESFDSDPGGDPGYIIWDDSDSLITISGNVYSDEGVSPIGAPTCDDTTENVRMLVQGGSASSTSCDSGTGAYSFSNIAFNPGDSIIVYLNTDGGTRAATVTVDPLSNISNMHLYQDRVIVRHEDTSAIDIDDLATYDSDQDDDIPFDATSGSPDTLILEPNTELHVWTGKTFTPGGNVTLTSGGSGETQDGTLHVADNGTLTFAGTESHSVGGNWTFDNNAAFTEANSTVVFTATTTGKTITATSSPFYNTSFTGSGGAWSFPGGDVTVSHDMSITAGTVTLPNGTTTVGASFDNNGGTFVHNNGTLYLTATLSGEIIRLGGANTYNLTLEGSGGGWTFQDSNATTSNDLTIIVGSTTLPSGIYAVGASFNNSGGTFNGNGGVVELTSSASGRTVYANGSLFANLLFSGNGGWVIVDNEATSTGSFTIASGTVTLATGTLAVGTSFENTGGSFDHATATIRLFGASTGQNITPNGSLFYNLIIDGASGGWTLNGNATTSNNFELLNASSFSYGDALEVGGTFTNTVGGSATTWAASIVYLNSGLSQSINTKGVGDNYQSFIVGSSTDIRMWHSVATTTTVDETGSLYSQDHAANDGDLFIWGDYERSTGSEFWSYATDFDGVSLSGGSERQVDVRMATSATTTFSGASLQILGISTATTTVDNQGSDTYAVEVTSGTLNAQYYQFRNLSVDGLNLSGSSTVISSLSNGDFELAVDGGTMLTVASTTVDNNPTLTISTTRFATSTGVSSGFNASRDASSTNDWVFSNHYGNYDGESFDNDGGTACGSFVWDDSSCLLVTQAHYRWRNDDGGEGVPPSEWYNSDWAKRKQIRVTDQSGTASTDLQVKLIVDYDADMQSDFDDLRFTDDSGTTTLDYWIESFITSASSTVWVKIPSLPASSFTEIYMYYGSSTATDASASSTTFVYFDDFEDDNIVEYSGDTSLFDVRTVFNAHGTYGLDAFGNVTSQTTDGIYRTDITISQGSTIRYFQYIDTDPAPAGGDEDEPCTLFGIQTPGSDNNNYAVCLDPFNTDQIVIAENVSSNDGSGTTLASTNVTFTTGWYEVEIDWLTTDAINVSVYRNESLFATVNTTDSSYTSGGVGFSYWSQHGGWDFMTARKYISVDPTVSYNVEQNNNGATWKAAEDTSIGGQAVDENVRLRFTINNTGAQITDQNFQLQFAPKGAALQCESVPSASYTTVPTDASCGSSAFCMATSTHFTNRSSSTPHLSTPGSSFFTYGQIIEDPTNDTGNITVEQSEYTEVEYVFQLTSNASEPAYCLRATDSGSPFDNYSRVAEIGATFLPEISDWTLNDTFDIVLLPGVTTTISATGTATDLNGYADLDFATSTFFRTGVSEDCSADDNNCYQVASTSCSFNGCSGNSCTLQCDAEIWFFADPTDVGAFSAEEWRARASLVDDGGNRDLTTSLGVELLTLRALDVTGLIDYGSLSVGADTGPINSTTTVTNIGNDAIDISLLGTDLTNGPSAIPVANEKYATTTFTYSSCGTPPCSTLATTSASYELDLLKPTTTTSVLDDIFWGLFVPTGVAGAIHDGINTFTAIGD